jgi:hypothetical protein
MQSKAETLTAVAHPAAKKWFKKSLHGIPRNRVSGVGDPEAEFAAFRPGTSRGSVADMMRLS